MTAKLLKSRTLELEIKHFSAFNFTQQLVQRLSDVHQFENVNIFSEQSV